MSFTPLIPCPGIRGDCDSYIDPDTRELCTTCRQQQQRTPDREPTSNAIADGPSGWPTARKNHGPPTAVGDAPERPSGEPSEGPPPTARNADRSVFGGLDEAA